jgi:hypothetical protein
MDIAGKKRRKKTKKRRRGTTTTTMTKTKRMSKKAIRIVIADKIDHCPRRRRQRQQRTLLGVSRPRVAESQTLLVLWKMCIL